MPTIAIIAASLAPPEVRGDAAVLTDPRGLALDRAGNLLVSCGGERPAVVLLSRKGEKLLEIGAGRLSSPQGLAIDGKGRIVVADPGKGEVVLFGEDGAFLASSGGLADPRSVAIGPGGKIAVSEAGGSRIAVLEGETLKPSFAIDRVRIGGAVSPLKGPAGLAAAGGRLAVSDAGNGRILVIPFPEKAPRNDGEAPEAEVLAPFGLEPGALAFGKEGRLYAVDRQQVCGFAADRKEFGAFKAASVRMWYEPRGIAADPSGNVLSVDGSTRRVLATSADLFDGEPRIRLHPGDPGTVSIEWETLSAQPAVLRYGLAEDCAQEIRDDRSSTRHEVVLRGLAPATRYYFHASCPLEAIPPTTPARTDLPLQTQRTSYRFLSQGNFTGEYGFATLPEEGMTDWTAVPVLVLVYQRVSFPEDKEGKRPPDRVLDDGDLSVLRSELETYRVWAWRHSSCKVNLEYCYILVGEARDAGQLGDITPQVLEDLEKGTVAQGKDLDGFWSAIVVGVHGWYANYLAGPVAGSTHELGSCYTGFGHGTRPGWWWFPTHEHGHLLHSMVMCSNAGFFAFPDAPWTLPGKFGEDFSFLAYNYRQMPPRGWLLLKRSAIRQSLDKNSNGVPDDDPLVPLDEKRFGWTADRGGDCRKRLMAGVRTPGFPGGTDTDFEGKVHRLNEGELYWVDRKVPRSTPVLDGKLREGEWKELYSIPNLTTPRDLRGLRARVFLAWDEKSYYFAVQSSRKVSAGFDLDGANDGWFHGRDNLRFSVRPEGDGPAAKADGAIWDFLNNVMNVHDGQLWWREAYRPGDIAAASGREGDWWILECAVPARPGIGIAPAPGARFAIRASLWSDPPDPVPSTGFFDGEDFVYDLECVGN